MTRTIQEILGDDVIRRLRMPIAEAGGLPGVAYTSQEFFDLERERLFPRVWTGIGFTSDVPEPGDAIPLVIAGVPLILCRDGEGEIRVFHNVCRHRAAIMLEKPEKGLKQFSCPYHAWAYSLNGDLKGIPYFDGTPSSRECGLDWSKNGLVPVRVGVWHHWIFVNLDGKAPPLEEYIAPLIKLTDGFDIGATRFHTRLDWEFDANWKFQNDNWETYHHIWVHEQVFRRMSDDIEIETRRPWMEPLNWENVATLWHREGSKRLNVHESNGLPWIPFTKDVKERRGGTSIIFPNVTMTLTPDHIASVITDPVAPDKTRAILGFFFVGDAATAPEFEDLRKPALDRWLGKSRDRYGNDGIRSQDFRIWEGQQIARKSTVADDVKFSPVWEQNIHYFQNRLVDALM